jgi:PAS domain S-box-containing protein
MDEHIDHYTLQALDGFIVVLSSAGNILYVSETVSGHLGHSQVDLLGRSLFEYSHIQDHEELKEALKPHTPCPGKKDMTSSGIGKRETTDRPSNGCSGRHVCCRNERNFFLRIKNSLSKKGGEKKGINCPGFKVIHLAGRIRFAHGEDENPSCLGLLAVCKPLDPPPMMEVSLSSNLFMSRHSMDMRFIFCDQRISQLTGYNPSDMLGRVVYHFHHPNDMSTIAGCHSNLISKGQSVSKSYRFLMKTGDWMWLQTKAVISYNTRSQKAQFITCYNYVVR